MKSQFRNLDDNESVFFLRELEHVKSKTYDIKYPELKARSLFPVSFEAGPGAESITYEQYSQLGLAKIISDYADDLPTSDAKGKEFTSKIKSLGGSYRYNLQEVRAAQLAGKPLNQRKAASARRAHLFEENNIAWYGDADCGLPGFLSNTNINTVVLPADGAGGLTTFASKSADQILRDMASMPTTVHSVTKGVEFADTMLMPLEQYNLIANTRIPDTSLNVMQWFLGNNPHIKDIMWVNELKGAGAGGTDVMMVYRRDPNYLTLEIPQDFEQLPVQENNLAFKVPTHQRIGGVLMYYPLAVARADGI